MMTAHLNMQELHETVAQQNRLIKSQQLSIHEYQRQVSELNNKYNIAVEFIKELENKISGGNHGKEISEVTLRKL